ILSNNKADDRKGKVQLIDAGQLYRKLRKNLGNKNCELSPQHIREILEVYEEMKFVEREGDEGIAAKVFDNADFGYYKVTVERPKRLKAEFTAERIAELRYDKTLREPMEWAYQEFGEEVYSNLGQHEKTILDWAEKQELNLSAKQAKALVSKTTWQKQLDLLDTATKLMQEVGTEEYSDFNLFRDKVDAALKTLKIKLSATEKKAILNAVSWYDGSAEKVVKGISKINSEKLERLLDRLGCEESQLADYGY